MFNAKNHQAMKKFISTIVVIVLTIVSVSAQERHGEVRFKVKEDGRTFVQQKGVRSSSSSDRETPYKWEDTKGNVYPIFLHTYTRGEKAGRTTCYVVKTSAKTGKEYKYYLPDGEAIAEDILNRKGI